MNALNTTTINPVKPSDLHGLAEAALLADAFLFILGSGGAGKTSIVCNELSASLNRKVWYVNLNGQGPQEVIGYGKILDNGDMEFAAPSIWPTLKRVGDEPVILFLDEVNDYDPAVRALLRSLYPSSGNRMVGPHILGSNVLVICASNRRQDGTKATIEEAPFTERCFKVTLEPNLNDWLDWVDGKPALAQIGSHVPAFLRFGCTTEDGPDMFNPPITMPYDGAPHPCPRTWEKVVRLEPLRKTAPSTFMQAVRGAVGDRAAAALAAFHQHVDSLPDIEALKADPESFEVPSDPAKQFAMVSASLAMSLRGVADPAVAVHKGGYDWMVSLLVRCRGDIREYGARSAVRRGIPLDEHPKSRDLIL